MLRKARKSPRGVSDTEGEGFRPIVYGVATRSVQNRTLRQNHRAARSGNPPSLCIRFRRGGGEMPERGQTKPGLAQIADVFTRYANFTLGGGSATSPSCIANFSTSGAGSARTILPCASRLPAHAGHEPSGLLHGNRLAVARAVRGRRRPDSRVDPLHSDCGDRNKSV